MEKLKSNLIFINSCYTQLKEQQEELKKITNNIDQIKKSISDAINNKDSFHNIRVFISYSLQEAIDKFDLNKGKEDNRYIECKMSSCSTGDSDIIYSSYKHENPRSKFNPFEDKWEFHSIEEQDGKFKITVENIKGRQYIGAFNWVPDLYYTDWIDLEIKISDSLKKYLDKFYESQKK